MDLLQNIYVPGIKHSFTLRPHTTDTSVFNHVFIKLEYNFKPLITPKIIIDGGANIGLSSIYFKNRFPNSKIIAIEPDKENYKIMTKNLSLYDNIHLKHSGLWNKKTTANVIDKFNNGEWGMSIEESTLPSNNNITTVTITDIINEFNIDKIDLLKLDIEGAEKYLFKDNFAEWLPKVKIILIELHDWIEKGCSKPFFEALNSTLNNYSFDIVGENVIIINEDIKD
jgi:FkbM family methyltransferase